MKKKNLKKLLLAVCCAALLVCVSIGATVAYLTSTSTVKNTFTVGKVNITLDETAVDTNGDALTGEDAGRRTENTYKLMPGHEYKKDPTVHVTAGSEESYVRMKVKIEKLDELKAAFPSETYPDYYTENGIFLLQKLVGGWENSVWQSVGFDAATNTYEFRYVKTATVKASATDNLDLEPLFETITIPGSVDAAALANLNNVEVVITAEAIQADGFADAAAAWEKF